MKSVSNEDDDPHEEDAAKTMHDEIERSNSLFSGTPSPTVLRLKVGATVLCTQMLDNDVRVGYMGVVLAIRDPAEGMQDETISEHDMGYGVTPEVGQAGMGPCPPRASRGIWPLVGFTMKGKAILRTVYPALLNIEDNMGTLICSHMQLPTFILAYTLTGHRVQGMTVKYSSPLTGRRQWTRSYLNCSGSNQRI